MKSGCGNQDAKARRKVRLPVLGNPPVPEGAIRKSRSSRWRAAALITLNVLMIAHVVQWRLMGRTISPIEPSESMYTLQNGFINAGFIFFTLAILSTLVFGRFVCGWGCHVLALQDLCAWLMKKLGVTPKPFRSRLLVFVPLLAALYMFVWPTATRFFTKPQEAPLVPAFTNHLVTSDFWATFPPVAVAIPFLFICGFMTVYFLGSKGFCTYACPYGGFFVLADKVAPGKIRVTDACNQCGHCTAVCTSNVVIHAEVKAYGMVVDPGCMKCMDCVSVCPNDALYFGFGKPTIAVARKAPKHHPLTWREEVAALAVFAASFWAAWDVYQLVPMLMALGAAAITTFLALQTAKMLRARDFSFHRFDLNKPSGRVRYRLGEGVTGMVAQSGAPVVVPRVSREPRFLHRAAGRGQREDEITFLCVPIALDGGTAGTLAIEQRYLAGRDGGRTVSALRIAAGMIGQALRIQRLIDAERRQLVEENTQLRQELREHYDFSHLIGNSGPMRRVFEEVGQVVGTTATVLIRGESGTGKELIAHALHQHSPRAGKPFVRVNCAALPETLVESELFGYERGAFTGAQARRKGRFELADGGTLFLDEIGELSPSTQAKLLRVVQEREFERLGGTSTIGVDVRLITATNKDLEQAQVDGTFRQDLYYRLSVFTIWVPPLRERKSDILLLADHFVEKYARLHGRSIKRISTPAIDMLVSYHWPGNVRELENTLERAVLVADGDVIHGHHLTPTLQTAEASGTVVSGSLGEAVAAFESNLIQDALKTTRGNRARAARLLSTTERIINYKIRRYGIDPRRFRG